MCPPRADICLPRVWVMARVSIRGNHLSAGGQVSAGGLLSAADNFSPTDFGSPSDRCPWWTPVRRGQKITQVYAADSWRNFADMSDAAFFFQFAGHKQT